MISCRNSVLRGLRRQSWLSKYNPFAQKKLDNSETGYLTLSSKYANRRKPFGAGSHDQLFKKPEDRLRPLPSSKSTELDGQPDDLPVYIPPMPRETHLAFHSQMIKGLQKLGDNYKIPQEWDDYMDYAVENGVGLSPENPHMIYAESGTAITSCICDPEMPFVNYHFVHENNGEPMVCMCGYFFKLERKLVAPPLHKLMEIPDGGHFDPRAYNPDNNTYREFSWLKSDRVTRFKELEKLTPGSGLNYLEEEEKRQEILDQLEGDTSQSKFVLDYRQKPDGYLNYLSTELRYDKESDSWESILIPADDNEQLKAIQEEIMRKQNIAAGLHTDELADASPVNLETESSLSNKLSAENINKEN